ncbi:MAG: aminotransferase [Burkholderiales bacterium]|nr:aminotransferase [Burkholderiales bacterium]
MTTSFLRRTLLLLFIALFAVLAIGQALVERWRRQSSGKPRLFFGSVPIINNRYWALAMQRAGYVSETFVTHYYSSINKREDWGRLLSEEYARWPQSFHPYLGFLDALRKYDVFFISCQGVFVGATPLKRMQAWILKLAKKKTVVLPYGADSYVYRSVRSTSLMHGLLSSYPEPARKQAQLAEQVEYWVANADAFIPGFMGADGFGRWDVLIPSHLFIDASQWRAKERANLADGRNGTVTICHAPNHRGFKGTEFVLDAVDRLRAEGLQIELRLIEKMQNAEVRRVLAEEADILVEQLIFAGHGLNGLEGMACGLPVVSNLDDEAYIAPMRRWSYLGECPIVSATPENLVDVLRRLVMRPELRKQLGDASRQYVEKYHDLDSAAFLFEEVIEYVYGRRSSLINLYHPLLGEYPRRRPRIEHPLVNNRIVD